jgi:uncharacterized protein (TIGR03032 family)
MKPLSKQHQEMLREPSQITGLWSPAGVRPQLLEARADKGWNATLRRLGVTLLVTREYEHLLLALSPGKTTWLHLPHPSGLAVDRGRNAVHVACTRNPNVLLELKGRDLLPSRACFLPGSLYLHDLALIGGKLYGNAVGRNAVVRLDYDSGAKIAWRPACVKPGSPAARRNHLQLNSIAAGRTIRESYFSASVEKPLPQVPGDLDYPVDRKGVVFSGRTGKPAAWGLTRPHSARAWKGRIWVDNSGYGEVGYLSKGRFNPIAKLEGWTRGLCFVEDVLFVGISRVLPRFRAYAPGLDHRKSLCGLTAMDPRTGRILGRLVWPHGNQIFAIDWMKGAQLPYGRGAKIPEMFFGLKQTSFAFK